MKTIRKTVVFACLACLLPAITVPQAAFGEKVKIALLEVVNGGKDPRYDYLEGLLSGLLLYDLSSQDDITIVERSSLESILKEQELRISDLAETRAFEVGKILGADFLLKASFVFLGEDIVLSATIMDVASSKSLTLAERGRTENLAHILCEKIVKKLTGRDVTLSSELHERSILSMKDEKPGSISVHTAIIDAEIFLDGEFVSYSTGNERTPVKIENVKPGKHNIRVYLRGFGVLKQPELTFHDWEETVDVLPGKNHVLRARPHLLSDLVYDVRKLVYDTPRIDLKDGKGDLSRSQDAGFTDRKGVKVPVTCAVTGSADSNAAKVTMSVVYAGKERKLDVSCKSGEQKETNESIEKIEASLRVDFRGTNVVRITYEIKRNDVSIDEFSTRK